MGIDGKVTYINEDKNTKTVNAKDGANTYTSTEYCHDLFSTTYITDEQGETRIVTGSGIQTGYRNWNLDVSKTTSADAVFARHQTLSGSYGDNYAGWWVYNTEWDGWELMAGFGGGNGSITSNVTATNREEFHEVTAGSLDGVDETLYLNATGNGSFTETLTREINVVFFVDEWGGWGTDGTMTYTRDMSNTHTVHSDLRTVRDTFVFDNEDPEYRTFSVEATSETRSMFDKTELVTEHAKWETDLDGGSREDLERERSERRDQTYRFVIDSERREINDGLASESAVNTVMDELYSYELHDTLADGLSDSWSLVRKRETTGTTYQCGNGTTRDGSGEYRSLVTVDFPDGTYRTQWTRHNEITVTFEGYDDEDYWITSTEEYTHDETYFLELPSTEFVKHLSGRMPPGMENLGSARSNLLDAGTSLEPGGGIPYVPVPEAVPAKPPGEMAKPVLPAGPGGSPSTKPDSIEWAATKGVGQGGLNILNGIQDGLIGSVNSLSATSYPASILMSMLSQRAFGTNEIPSPDWSRGILTHEAGEPGTWSDTHGWSKFLGGTGASVLGGYYGPKIAGAVKNAFGGVKNWMKSAPKPVSNPVEQLGDEIKKWLGKDYRIINKPNGDTVFISQDGLRKYRTDFFNKRGEPPHVHFEDFSNGVWKDADPRLPHKIKVLP